jgi:hypothetical protein
MATEIHPAQELAVPMGATMRTSFGVVLTSLFGVICTAVVLLWPVPPINLDQLRGEKEQADLALVRGHDAALHAGPAAREAAVAQESLAAKEAIERAATLQRAEAQFVRVAAGRVWMPRELSYLVLAMLLGGLGSFLQAARSFADFAGNRTLVASWAWWYTVQPFVGATLALFFYLVIRGGLLSGAASAADLSPHAVAAVSGLVGMFSKQASDKLNEIFSLLLKTSGEPPRKDKINPDQTSGPDTSNTPATSA